VRALCHASGCVQFSSISINVSLGEGSEVVYVQSEILVALFSQVVHHCFLGIRILTGILVDFPFLSTIHYSLSDTVFHSGISANTFLNGVEMPTYHDPFT